MIRIGCVEPLRTGELRCYLASGKAHVARFEEGVRRDPVLTAGTEAGDLREGAELDEGLFSQVLDAYEVFSPWHDGEIQYRLLTIDDLRSQGGGRLTDHLDALEREALGKLDSGDQEAAVADLDEVLRLAPSRPLARTILAILALRNGDLGEAAEHQAHFSVSEDSDDAPLRSYEWLVNQSVLLGSRGLLSLALEAASAARALEPELNASATFEHPFTGERARTRPVLIRGSLNSIKLLGLTGQPDAGLELFEQVRGDDALMTELFASDPLAAELLYTEVLSLLLDARKSRYLDAAERILGEARAQFPAPQMAELVYSYACVAARRLRHEEALDELARALALGFSATHAAADRDLASLRTHPRFCALIG
jgi:tetratricopeptide (TPR) repeat protein